MSTMPSDTRPPLQKKSYLPPSKAARDNYYARKTIDEIYKAQSKKRKAREVPHEPTLRDSYERRLERTLQAARALSKHQTTDRLRKTEQAIRTVITREQVNNIGGELTDNAGRTSHEAVGPKTKTPRGDHMKRLLFANLSDNVARQLQNPSTPVSYDTPVLPPPAPTKPKKARVLDNFGATRGGETTPVRCIEKDEWSKGGS